MTERNYYPRTFQSQDWKQDNEIDRLLCLRVEAQWAAQWDEGEALRAIDAALTAARSADAIRCKENPNVC